MKIISGVYWDRGRRSENQDSLVLEQVFTRRGRVLLAAVSDGIGGLDEGETASGFILEKLLESFYHQMVYLIGQGKGGKALERCVLRCFFETSQMLGKYAKSREIKLGATVSVLIIWRRNYLTAHLGDSRIYRFTDRKGVRQITRDHSDGGCAITRCLGSFPYQPPDLCRGRIRGKNGFLLCSDGFFHFLEKGMLTEMLGIDEITDEEQIERRLRELAGYGIRRGEEDNSSALYVCCGKRGKYP